MSGVFTWSHFSIPNYATRHAFARLRYNTQLLMNQPAPADGAIREKLSTYADPYLGQTLGEAKAIVSVAAAKGW